MRKRRAYAEPSIEQQWMHAANFSKLSLLKDRYRGGVKEMRAKEEV